MTDAPSKGAIVMQPNGKFVYTPTENKNGLDILNISYIVNAKKYSAQIQIAISPVNDAPTAKVFVIGRNGELDFNEEVSVAVGQIASDVDGDSLTISSVSSTI